MSDKGFCIKINTSQLKPGTCRARGPYHVPLHSVPPERKAKPEETVHRERTLRAQAEFAAEKLANEACRLKKKLQLLRAARSSALQDRKKFLRRLLLEFHPDKSGGDTVFTSTAVTQKITALLQEQQ